MINDKARALTEQIESSVNALAAETDAVRKSETFLNWLNAMAQFHSYSWNNQFLISIQCPGASKVAGFQTWKKLGRNVKKGAKGIAILAPCLYRRKADPENEDSPTVQKLGGFKVAYVFDHSATEGEPLPSLQYAAAAGGEDLLPKLEAAAGKLAVQLEYLEIPEPGVQGYSTGGKIVIRQSLSTASKCAVIAHEISHLCYLGIYVVISVVERANRRRTVFDHHIIGSKVLEELHEGRFGSPTFCLRGRSRLTGC